MSDFAEAWNLSRGRFIDSIKDLNSVQLNWRLHPGTLTIGEMVLHVAGVEVYFCRQLLGLTLDEFAQRVEKCATDSVVNENPFPFTTGEISPELVMRALDYSRGLVEGPITNLTDEIRAGEVTTVLGPVVNGTGVMARFSFHPGYHQGQVHLIRTAPGFPA